MVSVLSLVSVTKIQNDDAPPATRRVRRITLIGLAALCWVTVRRIECVNRPFTSHLHSWEQPMTTPKCKPKFASEDTADQAVTEQDELDIRASKSCLRLRISRPSWKSGIIVISVAVVLIAAISR